LTSPLRIRSPTSIRAAAVSPRSRRGRSRPRAGWWPGFAGTAVSWCRCAATALVGCCGASGSAGSSRGARAVAEFEQLALDPHVLPARAPLRHLHHQGGEDVPNRWPSRPVRRCQRRIVFGVTRRWQRSVRGDRRTSAANTARSAQSVRGRGWCGAGWRPPAAARGARRQQDQSEHLLEDQVQQTAAARWDHPPTPIATGQQPRPEFWNATECDRPE
jgi:hypothetical protein